MPSRESFLECRRICRVLTREPAGSFVSNLSRLTEKTAHAPFPIGVFFRPPDKTPKFNEKPQARGQDESQIGDQARDRCNWSDKALGREIFRKPAGRPGCAPDSSFHRCGLPRQTRGNFGAGLNSRFGKTDSDQ